MRGSYTRLYVHLVWATRERQPWLTGDVQAAVYACVRQDCAAMKVEVLGIGGVADHVHLLVRFPAAIAIADLVKQLKGSSSHLVTHRLDRSFQWQGGYGAFTLNRSLVLRVQSYIARQQEHHESKTLYVALERDADEDDT